MHPGLKHGLPAWHAMSGTGVPVVSPEFWVAPKQAGHALDEGKTGVNGPQWIRLVDPVTKEPFWFHQRFRSRRDEVPAADDDGSRGAWAGEPEAKRFVRSVDGYTNHAFYVDLAAVTTSWVRPAEFDRVGVSLASALGAPDHPTMEDETPAFPVELLVGRTFRDGTWWAEKRGGGTHFYSSTAFRKRLLVIRKGVLTYFKNEQEVAKPGARATKGVELNQYFVIHTWGNSLVTLLPFVELTSKRASESGVPATRQFVLRFKSSELADEAALAMGWLSPPVSMLRVELPVPSEKVPLAPCAASTKPADPVVAITDIEAPAPAVDGHRPAELPDGSGDGRVPAAGTRLEASRAAPKPPPLHLMPRKPRKPGKSP